MAANTPTATDPANPTLFKTAPFFAGPGASDGGSAIDFGGLAGASEETGDGDGGEVLSVGDGALAGGVFRGVGADAGVLPAGDGVGD